jgi:hypothetical protein
LADASGCFELTNLRVIWGRVAAIRRNLSIERLEQIFGEFQDKGLLFVWEHEGKRYGHWTGSDVPGRLPPPSWRMRLERLAPPVPKQALAAYASRYARGRAGLAGGGFLAEQEGETKERMKNSDLSGACRGGDRDLRFENSDLKKGDASPGSAGRTANKAGLTEDFAAEIPSGNLFQGISEGLKDGVDVSQEQDWNWNRDLDREGSRDRKRSAAAGTNAELELALRETAGNGSKVASSFFPSKLNSASKFHHPSDSNSPPSLGSKSGTGSDSISNLESNSASSRPDAATRSNPSTNSGNVQFRVRSKDEILASELMVGRGPVCGPVRIKPEALERIRQREAARNGTRSP